jgi:hypothetical protein
MKRISLKMMVSLPPASMKNGYKGILYVVLLAAVVLIVLSYFSLLGCDLQASRLIQIFSASAILVTAVIALSNADPPRKQVTVDIEPYITTLAKNWRTIYEEDKLTPEVQAFFANCPKPVTSYKVQFKITNASHFDWVNPVVTFWLPTEKQHPRGDDAPYSSLGYHSNTYNAPTDVKTLEMVDGFVVSNSNLPYWKQKKDLTIWIRMVLENCGAEPFDVEVSVDCEGAEGFTQTVKLNPKELLKLVGETTKERILGKTQS